MRIGIVGAGFMGRLYANVLRHHPTASLAGAADFRPGFVEQANDEFNTPRYADVESLLDNEQLDGLIVATDEHSHRQPVVAALERGVGVLVEKPLSTTIADGQAMIAAAERTGAVLLVGHLLRFDTRYALLQSAIRKGQIGQPQTLYARRWSQLGSPGRIGGRTSLSFFLGVHDFDFARWTVGSEVVRVVAEEKRGVHQANGHDIADAITAVLTFADGTLGTIDLNWLQPPGRPIGYDFRFEIFGDRGNASVVADYSGLSVTGEARSNWVETALWAELNGEVIGAIARETDHFVKCLAGQATPLISGADGLAAVQIALAVDEAARTQQAISLSPVFGS